MYPTDLSDVLSSMGYVLDAHYVLSGNPPEITQWTPPLGEADPYWPDGPSPEQVAAYLTGPEYLGLRKRQLIADLDAERLPRLDAVGWTNAARMDAALGLPTLAYQAHHLAESRAVAEAYQAAADAVTATADVAAAEVAAAAVQWPTLTGPEGAA